MNKKQKIMLGVLTVLIVILFLLLGKERAKTYYNAVANKVADTLPQLVTYNLPPMEGYKPVDYGIPDADISSACNMCGSSYTGFLPASYNIQLNDMASQTTAQQVQQNTEYVYVIANNTRPFGGSANYPITTSYGK